MHILNELCHQLYHLKCRLFSLFLPGPLHTGGYHCYLYLECRLLVHSTIMSFGTSLSVNNLPSVCTERASCQQTCDSVMPLLAQYQDHQFLELTNSLISCKHYLYPIKSKTSLQPMKIETMPHIKVLETFNLVQLCLHKKCEEIKNFREWHACFLEH